MKIQRFNEAYNYNSDIYAKPKDLSKKEYSYITDFAASADYNIIEWVSSICGKTKLKDFKNLTKSEKDAITFSELKDFKKLKELLELNKHIKDLDNEYKKILKNRDILYTEASNEVMYAFQEELIDKDFNKFFELFIKDPYDDYVERYSDSDYVYYDVHPRIMIEYGERIIEYVDTLIQSKKYNL